MSNLSLLDPSRMTDADWPVGSDMVRHYVESFASGSKRQIANVDTRFMILRQDDVVLPVTINDGEFGNAYVCSPYIEGAGDTATLKAGSTTLLMAGDEANYKIAYASGKLTLTDKVANRNVLVTTETRIYSNDNHERLAA